MHVPKCMGSLYPELTRVLTFMKLYSIEDGVKESRSFSNNWPKFLAQVLLNYVPLVYSPHPSPDFSPSSRESTRSHRAVDMTE